VGHHISVYQDAGRSHWLFVVRVDHEAVDAGHGYRSKASAQEAAKYALNKYLARPLEPESMPEQVIIPLEFSEEQLELVSFYLGVAKDTHVQMLNSTIPTSEGADIMRQRIEQIKELREIFDTVLAAARE
jgi:hypothetical protein